MYKRQLYTIVGNTGSGKSRLIKDIEQLANHDTITQRSVFIDDTNFSWEERQQRSLHFVAHLGQNMRFMLDTTVAVSYTHLDVYKRQVSQYSIPMAYRLGSNKASSVYQCQG